MLKLYTAINHAVTACTSENTVFLVKTDIDNNTVFLSWIYYCLFTIMQPGLTIWRRRYAFCMNDIRVRCAREVRQHYLCMIMQIPWQSFQRNILFYFVLIVVSFISIFITHYYKLSFMHLEVRAIWMPRYQSKATDRNFPNG